MGLLVQQDAELQGSSVHVEESSGPGLFLSGGLITCEGCTLEDNGFASAVALEGELVLSGGALQGSTPTPDLGGGVGLFAWSFHDLGVQLQDVEFAGHPGPAAYLRGPGSYQLDRVTVTDSAQLSLVPGAVVVLQGVEPWDPAEASGLRVLDSSFGELPVSALFFDSSGGSLEGNSFAEGPDYAVWTQSCGGAPAVEFVGPEPEHNDCQGAPRDLDPLLIYELELLEMFVLED